MKITRTRIAARRMIVLKTICLVLLPTSLIGLIEFFWNILEFLNMPAWLYLVIIFSQPVLAVFIVIYRLHKNHDGRLLEKWQKKDTERFNKNKTEHYEVVGRIQNKGYSIDNITSLRGRAFLFEITFSDKVIPKAMPVVILNGVKLPLELAANGEVLSCAKSGTTVICHAEKAITTNEKELVFRSGVSEYIIPNPYYIKWPIHPNGIVWQCEGHAHEKSIFINAKFFPNATDSALYPFVIFIKNRKIGEYNGWYIPEKKYIAICIGNLKKVDCTGRCCSLKPTFGKQKIVLPSPSVLSVNSIPKKEVAF